MTPEQIDNLQPGRELDMLIAENVMGYHLPPQFREDAAMGVFSNDSSVCPHFSTSIADAWQVVEELQAQDILLDVLPYPQFVKGFRVGVSTSSSEELILYYSTADTAPLAICKAALKAVTSEQDIFANAERFNESMHRDFSGEQDKLLYRQLEGLFNEGKQPLAKHAVDDLPPRQLEERSSSVPVMPHRWHTEPHNKCWCLEPEQPEEQEYSYSYRVPGCNNEPNPTNGYHCPRCRVDLEPEGMPK